ncbi:MAG: glycosyltransferase, partial [Clostridia bacterium]|nr:glycosyltransferase [Clostridia bacterium]
MQFSVSMCVYGKDNPEWFDSAVQSVLNQTVTPSEIVLVVDGPVPDELDEIIKKYESDEKFKVIRFAENKGHGDARRASVDACTNELIALMDADDVCLPERFEKQLAVFDKTDADIVGGDIAEFIDSEDNIQGYRRLPNADADIKELMKTKCAFNQVTVMLK